MPRHSEPRSQLLQMALRLAGTARPVHETSLRNSSKGLPCHLCTLTRTRSLGIADNESFLPHSSLEPPAGKTKSFNTGLSSVRSQSRHRWAEPALGPSLLLE